MKLVISVAVLASSVLAGFDEMKNMSLKATGPRAVVDMMGEQFDNIDGYGCWCYFYEDHGKGKSQPVNQMDGFCKLLAEGYDCAMMDSQTEGGDFCVPWEVAYNAANVGFGDVVEQCVSRNADLCPQRACIIEGWFVTSIFQMFLSGTPMDLAQKHADGFDVTENCPTTTGTQSEKSCCGEYPYRHPFKTYGGQRDCCGSKTYDVSVLQCCPSGKVKVNC